jgi:hypothetical protein
MIRISWKKQKKKHLPSNNIKDAIERETLERNYGNYTLRSAPNIFRKGRRNN